MTTSYSVSGIRIRTTNYLSTKRVQLYPTESWETRKSGQRWVTCSWAWLIASAAGQRRSDAACGAVRLTLKDSILRKTTFEKLRTHIRFRFTASPIPATVS